MEMLEQKFQAPWSPSLMVGTEHEDSDDENIDDVNSRRQSVDNRKVPEMSSYMKEALMIVEDLSQEQTSSHFLERLMHDKEAPQVRNSSAATSKTDTSLGSVDSYQPGSDEKNMKNHVDKQKLTRENSSTKKQSTLTPLPSDLRHHSETDNPASMEPSPDIKYSAVTMKLLERSKKLNETVDAVRILYSGR